MVVKVYGQPMSACTARVLACLEEKAVEYELVPVNVMEGAHKQQPYLSLNPFGQIPAAQDSDLTIFDPSLFNEESRVITKYVAYHYKESGADLLRMDYLSEAAVIGVWLEVEGHQFNPPISALVKEIIMKPKYGQTPSEEVIATQCEKLAKVLDVYEERLSKFKYLAGDHFSLADVNHLPYLHYFMTTDKAFMITSRPHVKAWWEAISSRPAWKKVAGGMKF